MRSVDGPRFLEVTIAVLESAVVPAVTDPAARRQLLICIGLLDNLVERIEDRTSLVAEEAAMLASMFPTAYEPPGDKVDLITLRRLRRSVSSQLRSKEVYDGMYDDEVDDLLRRCHGVLSSINQAELARLRPTRYGLANSAGATSELDDERE